MIGFGFVLLFTLSFFRTSAQAQWMNIYTPCTPGADLLCVMIASGPTGAQNQVPTYVEKWIEEDPPNPPRWQVLWGYPPSTANALTLSPNKTIWLKAVSQGGTPEVGPYSVTASTSHDQDFGESCGTTIITVAPGAPPAPSAPSSVGGPVNVTNGNMYLKQTDINVPSSAGEPIDLTRSYNSRSQATGMFGVGWSSPYDEKIVYIDTLNRKLLMPDGRAVYFSKQPLLDGSGYTDYFTCVTPGFVGTLSLGSGGDYTLVFKSGAKHHFNSDGKLDWQKDRNNNQTTLTYSGGYLTGVTDTFNRTLTLTNPSGLVTQTNFAGLVANYAYTPGPDGPLLQSVTYADGSKYVLNMSRQMTRRLISAVS